MGATSNEGTGVGSVEKSFSRIKNNIKKENFAPNAFGYISFDGVKIQGGENNSGDGNGFGTIELVPDKDLYENDQYLIIDPTAPNHIHIRAGGDVDNSNSVLIIGGENSNFQINSGEDPSVVVKSAENIWIFSADGILTIPKIQITATVPAHSYGLDGDKAGMIAMDGNHVYFCTSDYNEGNIWKRIQYSADTW